MIEQEELERYTKELADAMADVDDLADVATCRDHTDLAKVTAERDAIREHVAKRLFVGWRDDWTIVCGPCGKVTQSFEGPRELASHELTGNGWTFKEGYGPLCPVCSKIHQEA